MELNVYKKCAIRKVRLAKTTTISRKLDSLQVGELKKIQFTKSGIVERMDKTFTEAERGIFG